MERLHRIQIVKTILRRAFKVGSGAKEEAIITQLQAVWGVGRRYAKDILNIAVQQEELKVVEGIIVK